MDYMKVISDCEARAEMYKKQDDAWNLLHERQCEDAITDLLRYKEAIERMGEFGKLFISYSGDPRGPIGTSGVSNPEEEIAIMPILEDVDGGKWRPVKADILRDLFRRIETAKAERDEARRDCAVAERNHKIEVERRQVAEDREKNLIEAITMVTRRAEMAEEIASDLLDDFTDFVTGGVPNAAPYCANKRNECVNAYGWCNGDNSVCRGFMPKAAVRKKEE